MEIISIAIIMIVLVVACIILGDLFAKEWLFNAAAIILLLGIIAILVVGVSKKMNNDQKQKTMTAYIELPPRVATFLLVIKVKLKYVF